MNPEFLLEPVHQDAAIVFVDLSGFTSLSETHGMDAVLEMLKDFHTLVDREVVARGGVITSFLGDGAMILFGLPESTADDACNAALCCVDLCNRAERWIESLPPSIASLTGFKIGAHFGPIIASRLGGSSYQHITATGDTVNVANRLMEVAATHGAELALSDDLLRQAGPKCALLEIWSSHRSRRDADQGPIARTFGLVLAERFKRSLKGGSDSCSSYRASPQLGGSSDRLGQ